MRKNSQMSLRRRILITGLLLVAVAPAARAHKVNVFAYAEGDSVYTESYFTDGKKCRSATITVYTSSGTQVLEGKTDDEGMLAFPIPRREELKIVLNASMGHRAEYVLTRGEFPGGNDPLPAEAAVAQAFAAAEMPSPAEADIARAVDHILNRRLSPLANAIRRLERKQEQIAFRDILGGIGYIVGLMGLLYYVRQRMSQ